MMDLLLDTHVAIWWMEGSDRLGSRCKATLFRPRARLWISTASVWEMAIKSGLGRLKLSTPLDECIPDLFARGALCLPISLNHALAVRTLPPPPPTRPIAWTPALSPSRLRKPPRCCPPRTGPGLRRSVPPPPQGNPPPC